MSDISLLKELGYPEELLPEFTQMVAAVEEFKATDKAIAKIVAKSPKLTKEEFTQTIQEGDVVVAYKKQGYVEKSGIGGIIITPINKLIQGSSFTSCKTVGRNAKEIIGYGVIAGKSDLQVAPLDLFFTQHEGAVICRHDKITPNKAKLILDRMYWHYKMKTDYDFSALLSSVIRHMIHQRNLEEANKNFNETRQSALICSSLILKVYQECGLEVKHDNGIGDKFIWPREFLTSPSFNIVGSYFSKEAKVK